jgi:hypothetical protein
LRRVAVTGLVLGLLAATTVAFAVTEALKLERSPITRVRASGVVAPTCGCSHAVARLAFRLRRADTLDLVMVDVEDDPVRTLAVGSRRTSGRVVLRWDGRDDDGTVVPDGSYRLRVHLAHDRRTILVPNAVRVDTEPPAVELIGLKPRRISPDGDGRADATTITFRVSERARPLVLVDGAVVHVGKPVRAGTREVVWDGKRGHRPLGAGAHSLALAARDTAGNVSSPTESVTFRIRYLRLRESTVRARRGFLRVHVLTDARAYEWELFRRGKPGRPLVAAGPRRPGPALLRLPAKVRPGRYVLRVTANGHSDDAVVIVGSRR